jgi:DNA-directed RNA polymerase subunit omega
MAKVTFEDCIKKISNRFKLVLMSSRRAKDIERGAPPSVMRDNDKPTIIALREIAEDTISLISLEELTKKNLGKPEGGDSLFIEAKSIEDLDEIMVDRNDPEESDEENEVLTEEDLNALSDIDAVLNEEPLEQEPLEEEDEEDNE